MATRILPSKTRHKYAGAAAVAPYQPATTDCTAAGLLRARNAMRLRLWADDGFAHTWLCHPGRTCEQACCDGEGPRAEPARVALYQGDLEVAP